MTVTPRPLEVAGGAIPEPPPPAAGIGADGDGRIDAVLLRQMKAAKAAAAPNEKGVPREPRNPSS